MTPAGGKSIGQYGGFESFLLNMLQHHKDNKNIKYHIACKANGDGYMNLEKLPGATKINNMEFSYCNAHCFMIRVPQYLGVSDELMVQYKKELESVVSIPVEVCKI